MGQSLFGHSKLKEMNVLMVGMDAAGKTTILYKLRPWGKEVKALIPTIGFNIETLEYGMFNFTVWDEGGNRRHPSRLLPYYQATQALIFVIDSVDPDNLGEAVGELQRLLNDEALRDVPLLVWANKSDLPNTMSLAEITDELGLSAIRMRNWNILRCCALTGEGLQEGLEWLQSFYSTV
mmetsp:Transcript_32266/g.55773  ORF Transcript_32266/g.55773 Transcript_32266/m.55773 type:complete len:179 (+) Transcript_32266:38-574(+)